MARTKEAKQAKREAKALAHATVKAAEEARRVATAEARSAETTAVQAVADAKAVKQAAREAKALAKAARRAERAGGGGGSGFWRVVLLSTVLVIGFVIYRAVRQYREDSVFDLAPAGVANVNGSERRSISPELLEILADPGDKGPVELVTDADGKEWLVNRRNGYRYPVEDGIPIMLLEEGEKHRDEGLIRS